MSDTETAKKKKDRLVKILVPGIMILIIAGIWGIKNAQKPVVPDTSSPSSAIRDDNPDFALDLTSTIDLKKLKSYGLPILIDFGADSCAPCRALAPILKKLNSDLRGKAIIRYVDVDKYPKLVGEYPIRVIPTQVLINAGGEPFVKKGSGAASFKTYYSKTSQPLYTLHEGGMTEADLRSLLIEMGMEK